MSTVSKIDRLISFVNNSDIDKSQQSVSNEDDIKTDYDDDQEYILYYWPLKNRGNFIRLLFAVANVPYQEISSIDEIREFFWSKQDDDDDDDKKKNEYVPMYPPALKVENIKRNKNDDLYDNCSSFIFCQTLPIILYLSEQFDFLPNDKFDQLRAHEWSENLNDLIVEIYHQNYSELKTVKGRKCKISKIEIMEWINTRFYRFLDPMEQHLINNNDSYYFFDDKLTYFDLVIFNILDGLNELFGDKYNDIVGNKYKNLNKHYLEIGRNQYIHRLIQQQKENNIPWFWLPDGSWKKTKKMMQWN